MGRVLLPLTDEVWLACIFMALAGIVWGPYTPLETTLLRRTVPKAQLGRVLGARTTLLTSGSPLGLAVSGLLAFVPTTVLIMPSGLACVLVGEAGSPTLRNLSSPATAKEITSAD